MIKGLPPDNSPTPVSDPKLKLAADEIRDILRKHDIAGVASICSGEHSEYINHFMQPPYGPSWSCLSLEDKHIRIKAKAKRDHSERMRLVLTTKMIYTMRDLFAMQFDMFDRVANVLMEHLKIDLGSAQHAPHVEE